MPINEGWFRLYLYCAVLLTYQDLWLVHPYTHLAHYHLQIIVKYSLVMYNLEYEYMLISMPNKGNKTVTYTEPGMEASRWSRFFFSFALNDDLRTERRTPPSFSAPVISRWLEQSLPDNSEVFSNFMFLLTVLSWFSSSSSSSWLDKNASTFLSSENPAERN